MSNYCGLCNGHLNGTPCHANLEEAEREARELRKLVVSATPLIEYLAADIVMEREATNERIYAQGLARAWIRTANSPKPPPTE